MTRPVDPYCALLTDDASTVLEFAVNSFVAGTPTALATLLEIRGGGFRRLGAQMGVRADGAYCGFVSGGCTEAAVAAEALQALVVDQDRSVRFGAGSPYFDIVMPCGGGITVGIHVLRTADSLQSVLAALDRRAPAGLRYCPRTAVLQYLPGEVPTQWRADGFEVGYRPRARLVLYGRSIELDVTAQLARAAGFETYTSDGTKGIQAGGDIDEDCAVAILFHDIEREISALNAALSASPFYIGALGSGRSHERRVQRLDALGFTREDIARIKAPIGIYPGARDARSLALSVLADVGAARDRMLAYTKPE